MRHWSSLLGLQQHEGDHWMARSEWWECQGTHSKLLGWDQRLCWDIIAWCTGSCCHCLVVIHWIIWMAMVHVGWRLQIIVDTLPWRAMLALLFMAIHYGNSTKKTYSVKYLMHVVPLSLHFFLFQNRVEGPSSNANLFLQVSGLM